MAKIIIKKASIDVTVYVFIPDSTSTTGAGKTGLVYNSSGLVCYYVRPLAAAAALTLATQTVTGAHSDGGFVEVDATNLPGVYRLDLSDAVCAAGVNSVVVMLRGASGMAPVTLEIALSNFDLNSDSPDVNVAKISGDSGAADNLEAQYDGTGLTGDTYPSTQAQVGNIATTGAPAYEAASSFTKTVGGTEVGTYANTDTSNGVYHQIPDNAGTLDVYYEYSLRPDEVAVGVVFKGRMNGNGDNAVVQAYDWVGAAWVTIISLAGVNTTTDVTASPALVAKYTGTAAPNVGKVRVRIYGTGLTSANLYVDQCIVAKARTDRTVGYSQGAIWIDSTNGTAGTTAYYNGTADRPVSTWADALTLAAALSIYRFQVAPGTQITLAANAKKYALGGKGWKLALGGYDISYATIDGCELVTGVMTAADWEAFFWNCQMGACTLGEADLHNCHITDTVTLGSTSPMLFSNCVGVPIGTPGIDFGAAVGGTPVVVGGAKGVWTIANMKAGDTLFFDGNADLTLAASCTGGTVYISGAIRLTNSGSGQTIYQDGHVSLSGINAEMDTALDTAIPGSPTANSVNERIKAIDDLTQASGSGDLAAVKLKTDNLPSDPADESALEAAITALQAAILAKLPASLTGDGLLQVDIIRVSGDQDAADNLEAILDGTGGVTVKLKQLRIVGEIGSEGALHMENSSPTGYGLVAYGKVGGAYWLAGGSGAPGFWAYGMGTNGVGFAARGSGSGAGMALSPGTTGTALLTSKTLGTHLASGAVAEIQSGLSTLSAAQVNSEVVDALAVDTYAEPGQGAPAATASLAAKINYLYKALINKWTQTSSERKLFDNAGTTVDQKSAVDDDGTTFTKNKLQGGP